MSKKAAAHSAVVLISPAGNEYVPGTPEEANNLIYGHGYQPKGDVSPDEAVASVPAPDGSRPAEGPPPNARRSGSTTRR